MRRSAALGIPALSILLVLTSGEAARADRIVEEMGRELLGPDGRTFIDKQDGFSIVLPSSDWKVHLSRYEPLPDEAGFQLLLAPPDGDSRLRIIEKIYPRPLSLEFLKDFLPKDPQTRNARTKIVEVAGMKCLEYEAETPGGNRGWLHKLSWLCDGKAGRKFVVDTFPGVPVDQWPAEEKVLRELIESFRILP